MTLCTNVLLFLYVLCWIWWYWRDVLVLRRNSREWQLGVGISCSEKQWTVQFWSYVLNSEVSTNGVILHDVSSLSRLIVWRCLADSVLASSSAGRCDVRPTRRWTLLTCAWQFLIWAYCTYLLTYCDCLFCRGVKDVYGVPESWWKFDQMYY